MNLMPALPENFKMKSFWERPEGTAGMLIGLPVLAFLGWGLFKILPWIIILLENTLHAGLLLAGIGLLAYIVSSKRVRTLASFMFKSIMRAITRLFVEIDPIGILKSYVAELKNKEDELVTQIGKLRGTMRQLQNTISANQRDRDQAMQIMSQAKKMGDKSQTILKARKVGRADQANLTLQQLYNKMEVIYRVLMKMRETCVILIEDLEDEVKQQELQRKAIRSANSAFKAAMKIISGETEQKELYDQAMEFLAEDYAHKLGEMEVFMDISKDFIKSIDLQNGIYEADALQKLEEWEKKSDSLLLGGQKTALIAQAHDPLTELNLDEPLPDREDIIREGQVEKRERVDYGKVFERE